MKDKICVVTGATRGIGRAIATELATNGGTVIGTSTTDEGVERITNMFKQLSAKGEGVRLDVKSPNEIARFCDHVEKNYGTTSVLVNNAGISRNNLLLRIKEEEWDDLINTNLKSVYSLCRLFVRGMIKQRSGRIINISSVVGAVGNIGQTHYSAAKAGIIGFSKSLALETAGRNITVNVVAPGFISTDMTAELDSNVKDQLLAQIPMKRMGSTQDIANAVLFLASPLSSYVTGTTLYVDGGMLRR